MTSVTPKEQVLKIGSKGEIFPPKEIRDHLGLVPNQPIIMSVYHDGLYIRVLHDMEEVLAQPPKVTISAHAWKQFRKKFGDELEQ